MKRQLQTKATSSPQKSINAAISMNPRLLPSTLWHVMIVMSQASAQSVSTAMGIDLN